MNCSKVDMHMHSTASDGTDEPKCLVEKVKNAGIRVFSLTDHDTVAGLEDVSANIPSEVRFIPGIEFSCISEAGKCHILGYNCDVTSPVFRETLEKGVRLRREKLTRRLDYLQDVCGIEIDEGEREKFYRMKSVGKPHLAKMLIRKGMATSIWEAIDKYINPSGTEDSRLSSELVISSILASGGVPVWAHPLGGEGERRIGRGEFEEELNYLLGCGLRGLECHYSRYTESECVALVDVAEESQLLISGGSDYHGKNKDIGMGTLNAELRPVEPEKLTLLRELGILV